MALAEEAAPCLVDGHDGPFAVEDEIALMREHAIEILVTKNSGGDATRAKLDAARVLGVPVILMRRPPVGTAPVFHDLDALLAELDARAHPEAP